MELKKNFATYDIISKLPGIISLVGLLIGVGQLAYPAYKYSTGISTLLIMASIIALTMSSYNAEKERYKEAGVEMTTLFNKLRVLYYTVQNSSEQEFTNEVEELERIKQRFYDISISQQIFGADWYAHYKFFSQHQIDWVNEQKQFKFFKDKVPKSFLFFIICIIAVVYLWINIFVS
ncbi:SLATT domain-containing protein [Cohnella rhizosphaerae]|uniref:SLATT domain-containing protein n=1 Tax=Cohnella rhizosphaerae TaxID=1457232 RepID=A0A9X4KU36_9BACL|nr:SLATT domain-containing protein [Cohnella rhizosphaerae]MDG0811116.1 SLATT domain-containing protein [Cohnella rhizosphaerae]